MDARQKQNAGAAGAGCSCRAQDQAARRRAGQAQTVALRWLITNALARRARLPRRTLDFAVDAGNDLEVALEGAAFVAGDDVIIALGEHEPRESAVRFLDHVPARRPHPPL